MSPLFLYMGTKILFFYYFDIFLVIIILLNTLVNQYNLSSSKLLQTSIGMSSGPRALLDLIFLKAKFYFSLMYSTVKLIILSNIIAIILFSFYALPSCFSFSNFSKYTLHLSLMASSFTGILESLLFIHLAWVKYLIFLSLILVILYIFFFLSLLSNLIYKFSYAFH